MAIRGGTRMKKCKEGLLMSARVQSQRGAIPLHAGRQAGRQQLIHSQAGKGMGVLGYQMPCHGIINNNK